MVVGDLADPLPTGGEGNGGCTHAHAVEVLFGSFNLDGGVEGVQVTLIRRLKQNRGSIMGSFQNHQPIGAVDQFGEFLGNHRVTFSWREGATHRNHHSQRNNEVYLLEALHRSPQFTQTSFREPGRHQAHHPIPNASGRPVPNRR